MKKYYSEFILTEANSESAISNNEIETEVKPDEVKPDEVKPDEVKPDEVKPDESFDEVKGKDIIKLFGDIWKNNIITEDEINFSDDKLNILYKKQKTKKYLPKYQKDIEEEIDNKTTNCVERLNNSDIGDMFFYVDYPVKLIKKGLDRKPSMIEFFVRKNDDDWNSKIQNIINSKEYVDSSELENSQKFLRIDEFELMTDIDDKHTYSYNGKDIEFTFAEDGTIKSAVDTHNNTINLDDFDITKLKKEVKPETEVKPTEVKPTEVKPETEVKPTEVKPSDETKVKPTEVKPDTKVKPTEVKPETEVKPTEVNPTEVKPSDETKVNTQQSNATTTQHTNKNIMNKTDYKANKTLDKAKRKFQ